ncbi:MAG: thiamine pyrophosphate-binding protein [Elusimicrobia bacterium]|nr:thiamine pyrophosphate-binding protein [Elusimicrobiota bacterium]
MKLSDYVFDFVAMQGVKHVFLITGGGCMHLADSLGRNKKLEYVCCLHEQACAFAAEAYGEYSNRLGVALVTTGPGGTNTVTGVAAAWVESSPCLFLSGQVKRADLIGSRGVRTFGQQEIDIVSIVKPITKYAATVLDPESIRTHLEKAAYLATHGRPGPVWIDIPLDVQSSQIDESRLAGFDAKEAACPDKSSLKEAVASAIKIIRQSERPVLLFGNGVRLANAVPALAKLLERLRVPVLLTWKAMDMLPEDHPLYCGRPGGTGQRGANFTQQNSDCIVVIGARLDMPSLAFDHKNFARAAKKILVDADRAEIDKMQTEIHVPICADAGDFINEFIAQSDSLGRRAFDAWLARAKGWQAKYPAVLPECRETGTGYVSTYALVDMLSGELTASDLIVPGSSGTCSDILMQAFKVKHGQRILNAPGLGAMGTGVPGAIGACLASGRRRTICINGDGGFQVNIQELETVRRLDLPVKYFVLNNGGYASVALSQKAHFGRLVAANAESGLTFPDVVRVAAAYGLKTARMADNADIQRVSREVLAMDGPVVCEVLTSPDEMTLPRVTARIAPDGRIVSMPLEDMTPLLDREEFKGNMLIPPAAGPQ